MVSRTNVRAFVTVNTVRDKKNAREGTIESKGKGGIAGYKRKKTVKTETRDQDKEDDDPEEEKSSASDIIEEDRKEKK